MITSLFSLKNNKSQNQFEHRTGNLQNGELVHLPWVKWMRFEIYQDSNLYCIGERIRIFSSSLGCSHGILINKLQINWRPNQNVDHQILSYNSLGHNFGFHRKIDVFCFRMVQLATQKGHRSCNRPKNKGSAEMEYGSTRCQKIVVLETEIFHYSYSSWAKNQSSFKHHLRSVFLSSCPHQNIRKLIISI